VTSGGVRERGGKSAGGVGSGGARVGRVGGGGGCVGWWNGGKGFFGPLLGRKRGGAAGDLLWGIKKRNKKWFRRYREEFIFPDGGKTYLA